MAPGPPPSTAGCTGELLASVQVEPSILSADFARLGAQVAEVLAAGARVIHVDVMDGHFVPPITVGPLVVAALREQTAQAGAILDVHLMIERPERQLVEFIKAGADSLTLHAEATPHIAYAVALGHDHGASVGVALNPGTPVAVLLDLASELELALCMSVNPGWGGQPFIEGSPAKLRRLTQLLGGQCAIQVDGGIDPHTARRCREAGANLFVAGSAIFTAREPADAYRAIAAAVDAPLPGANGAGAPLR